MEEIKSFDKFFLNEEYGQEPDFDSAIDKSLIKLYNRGNQYGDLEFRKLVDIVHTIYKMIKK